MSIRCLFDNSGIAQPELDAIDLTNKKSRSNLVSIASADWAPPYPHQMKGQIAGSVAACDAPVLH